MLTERDLAILQAVARYYVLSRTQISRLCFPSDKSGRITRRRLQMLLDAGLINRTNAPLYNPRGGDPWPAYFPSKRGGEYLAEVTGDDRFLAVPFQTPLPQHLEHWIAVAETHIALEAAIAAQSMATLDGWINEWDTVNPDETAPENRFRLYTLIQPQPRLVCAPDAAFLLSARGHVKVFYLEQDRNTSGARQVAASKSKGYAAMAERQLHRRHFPTTTLDSFSVLTITTTVQRRDALRKAFRDVPSASLWKFACIAEITSEKLLFANVWHPTVGEPTSIIKPEVVQSTATAEPPAS